MNYQKLATTLLRVLGVWLLVQSIPQLAAATYAVMQMTNRAPVVSSALWMTPIMGLVTLSLSIGLFYASKRLAKIIAPEA